jgi:hypothetical protein
VAILTKIPPYLKKKKHENNGNVENFHGIICPYVVVLGEVYSQSHVPRL